MKHLYILTTLPLLSSPLYAEIEIPAFFSNGMVLQQKSDAPIWGWSDKNVDISVTFSGSTVSTKADKNGFWRINLKNLVASKEGKRLTISAGSDSKTIENVLVGEVWIASGQSNMEWSMNKTESADYAKTVNNPLIRQYSSANVAIDKPQKNYIGTWKKASPENTSSFSAVGFHFAEDLQQKLDVPVGIIELAWGGRPVEAFTSEEAIRNLPEAEALKAKKATAIEAYNPEKAAETYKQRQEAYTKLHQKWIENGKKGRGPRRPSQIINPAISSKMHSTIFNGMIHPFIGYGTKGAIWYQGESNAQESSAEYGELLECMVKDWRTRWGKEFSFYYVQLANFDKARNGNGWVMVQDEMRRALKTIPQSGMAVINDIGNATNIHPQNKKDVGLRLARWALHFDYGKKDVIYSGPLYQSTTFDGDKAIVSFDHAEGLKSRDGKALGSFEIANETNQWVQGNATIDGSNVIVSASSIKKPTKVRYAWKQDPTNANLINAAGLPASCFHSDVK